MNDDRFPKALCRACCRPTVDCRCPNEREVVLVAPDEQAAAIRAYLREHPELTHEEYDTNDRDPLLGLCYPAAESYYHVRDCAPEVYCLSWSDVDEEYDGTHWYLRESGGERRWIDLGLPATRLDGLPPFEVGTHRGFITGDAPSNRTQQVLAALDVS